MSNLRPCCGTMPEFAHRDTCYMNPNNINKEPKVAGNKSLEETMEERGNRYGEFADIAFLSQKLEKLVFEQDSRSFSGSQMNTTQREAMKMILHKIARVAVGDADYDDNWRDIQGYAKLVEDRLPAQESEE